MVQAVSGRRAAGVLLPLCRIEDDIVLASHLLTHKLRAKCLSPASRYKEHVGVTPSGGLREDPQDHAEVPDWLPLVGSEPGASSRRFEYGCELYSC
jgi:hypothetical protein